MFVYLLIFIFFRLLKYDPKTKKNTVLMNNLHFPNGVEISNDESFLLIIESMKFQVLKYLYKITHLLLYFKIVCDQI